MFQNNVNGGNGNPNNQNLLAHLLGQQSQPPAPIQNPPNNFLQNLMDYNRPQYDQPMNSGFSGGMSVGSVGGNSNNNNGGTDPLISALVQALQNKNGGMGTNNYNTMDYQNGMTNGGPQQRPGLLQQPQNSQSSSAGNLLSLLLGSNNGGQSSSQSNSMPSFMPSNQPNGMSSYGGNNMNSNNNILNDLLNALGQQGTAPQSNNMMGNPGNSNMMNNLPGLDLGLISGNGNGQSGSRMPASNQNMLSLNDGGLSGLAAALLGNNNNGGLSSGTSSQSNPLLSLLG